MKKGNIKFSLRRVRRGDRIRKKIFGTSECPRLCVFRSAKNIYAQVIDDASKRTLLSVSSMTKDLASQLKEAKGKIEPAKLIGIAVAKQAKEKNINKVVFDRNGYLYHGRVKALAEGAREGGLQF